MIGAIGKAIIAAVALTFAVAAPAQSEGEAGAAASDSASQARAVVEAGVAAHGGDGWLDPGTLMLVGYAEFYAADSTAVRSRADDYRMWRVYDAGRTSAHAAEGKVRISARSEGAVLFEVGFDGETTWNEKGIVPKAQADAFWASNFGFGIVRSALEEGFTLQLAPPRMVDGHAVELVRIVDPQGQETLFGFDADSHFIRYLAFRTPRGWHERTYDDFIRMPDSGWVQARTVTLYYDGVKSNTVWWREVAVGEPLDDALFAPPAE
ncbi:hypothetical protein [Paraurantiacibacter namhicola]|uniref:Outer membrane lipoprotein-sorting protein n=1 Tax=Paraurantiacibacter namhicola TaxID=645517 RepID=A0A1C7D4G9_9SPHN|nr:hypothetical protein [Paraurantiacibacter namhicola]ANU06355.1 hypothetical protein A6F65_00027 [Paraurantiacibacter namhicola]